MKYPQLMRMPSDVSEWLEEQLEQRGIDAIVYTRYVLSLLLYSSSSSSGGGNTAADQLWTWQQDMRRRTNNSARNTGVEEAERQRRLAAVNCLVAASDQPHHIEALVDELCDRLKRVNSDAEAAAIAVTPTPAATAQTPTSRHDLARRYYAAFPALQGSSSGSGSNVILVQQQDKWPLKRHGKEMNLATPPSKHRYTDVKRRESKRLDYASAAMKKRQMVFQRPPGIDRNWFITSRLEDWYTHNNNNNTTSSSFNTSNATPTTTTIIAANTPANDYMMINNDTLALDIVRDILDDSSDIYNTHTVSNLCYSTSNNNMLSFNNKYITNGTNIITSIWSSSEDDMAGWLADKAGVGMCLLQEQLEVDELKDEIDGFLLDDGCTTRWSEAVDYESQLLLLKSLEMLNHKQECSGFSEVMPKKQLEPYSYTVPFPPMEDSLGEPTEEEQEDLLHSAATHFRPISSSTRSNAHAHSNQPQYADGTTFYVSCTLDKLSYERSDDGASMFLDTGDGGRVEYMRVALTEEEGEGLQLKFKVGNRVNDKACQTDDEEEEQCVVSPAVTAEEEFFFPGDLELLMAEELEEDVVDEQDDEDDAYVRSEDNCIMEELFGKSIETEKCDKCSTSQSTAAFLTPTNNQLRSIWDAAELCVACLRLNAHSSGNGSNTGANDMLLERKENNNQQQEELRYDITKDGEQLLSDLSSIQNRYMMDEERYYYGTTDIRNKVLHYDYPSELTTIDNTAPQSDDPHHHHHPVLHSASFSFASRLQEDCLIKMATMPTLRSVTL